MSCCRPTDEKVRKSREIDKILRANNPTNKVKLLLLGPGESGKSTIFKQLKIIQNNGGFSSEELQNFRFIIHSNCISQMKILADIAYKRNIPLDNEINQVIARKMVSKNQEDVEEREMWSHQMGLDIKTLWEDSGIQKVYSFRNEFQLNDSASYFFKNIDRYLEPNYIPTVDDVLRARVKTTGIEEAEFSFEDLRFKMIDVGGQRSERKKWIFCFDNVTAVIFCVAISEYDQFLREDSQQQRMTESLILFEEICNSHWFRHTPFILFLNKMDLFKEKIEQKDLSICFKNYEGKMDLESASEFVKARFVELNQSPHNIYTQFTCAVSTEQMEFVFKCVREVLLKGVLAEVLPL